MLKCICRFGIGITMPSVKTCGARVSAQETQIFTHRKGTTMKKLLTAAFIVMLMACICIGGALFVQAQDETLDPVQHTHSWTYDYDTNTATCGAEGCDVTTCGPDNHVAGAEWLQKTDDGVTYHYHACTVCGIEMNKANCEGGTATCKELATCTGCGQSYGTYAAHNKGEATLPTQNAEGGYHYYLCTACGEEFDKETCEGGTATCKDLAICTGCGQSYGTLAEHAPSADWSQDATKTYHYHACTVCGEELGVTNCSGGTASCKELASCTECGNTYGGYADHVKGDQLQNTALNYHYYFCSVCEQEVEVEQCYGGSASCEERAICQGCGNAYGELVHNKDTVLKQNVEEGYHYYSCVDCGEELDVEACHGGTAADCQHLPLCAVCGNTYGEEYGAHTMEPIASRHEENPGQYHVLTYPCCGAVVEEEHTVGAAANCHSAAVCAVCNIQYGEIDPDNHDATNATYEPLNATHHKVICKCGEELEPAVHSGGSANCSAQAKCADCGAAYGTYNDVHSYDNDCDPDCNACGETRTPAEHAFGEWEVTKQPTETEEGVQKRTCSVCGETQTATIAVLTNPNGSGEPEPAGMKTSTVVLIVAIVVVAAVGIGAIVILTKKKK